MTEDDVYILGGFREMTRSDVQGGSAVYTAKLACTVGVFELENPLVAGGHSPRLMGTIEVAAEDVPEKAPFAAGQLLDVTDGAGTLRHCKIESWESAGPLWQITVCDLNQGA